MNSNDFLINSDEHPNGKEVIINGETYWMGTRINKCPMCGQSIVAVDYCPEFGNPDCPRWGIGKEEFEKRKKESECPTE